MNGEMASLTTDDNVAKVRNLRTRRAWAAWFGLPAALIAAAAFADGSALSRQEQKIVAAAAAENQRAISLLETLVNINSGTMNFAGVEQMGQIMPSELEPLGFTTRWHSMSASGSGGPRDCRAPRYRSRQAHICWSGTGHRV